MYFHALYCFLLEPWSIFMGRLLQTSGDSAFHGFRSQRGFIVAWDLLSLVCNYPKSHLWLPGQGIAPRALTCKGKQDTTSPARPHTCTHLPGGSSVELSLSRSFFGVLPAPLTEVDFLRSFEHHFQSG